MGHWKKGRDGWQGEEVQPPRLGPGPQDLELTMPVGQEVMRLLEHDSTSHRFVSKTVSEPAQPGVGCVEEARGGARGKPAVADLPLQVLPC